MATLDDRPFSKDYSGLVNQSVIAGVLTAVCLVGSTLAKRERRGQRKTQGLGSVESWEFGYLYQGRSWAKNASPPLLHRWPFQWISEALWFPESKLLELRGMDATVYSRWLRGCTWFTFIQSITTVPILLPIHVHFAGPEVSLESMTRASISALVETPKGRSLLWIHLVLLFWITFSWVMTLIWICRGAFEYRAVEIERAILHRQRETQEEQYSQYHPHPQPQHLFSSLPSLDKDRSNRGIRLRTVMVTNVPLSLRSEKDLEEYFRYYFCRSLPKPLSVPLPLIDSHPGITNKIRSLIASVMRATQPAIHLRHPRGPDMSDSGDDQTQTATRTADPPRIERVVVARKMTELASLLERREGVLCKLEAAHIRLATRVLDAVRLEMLRREGRPALSQRMFRPWIKLREGSTDPNLDMLVRELGPFVHEFNLLDIPAPNLLWIPWKRKHSVWANLPDIGEKKSIWEALHALPRSALDRYQPLIRLSVLFRGKPVPAIDYYTAKLDLLTSLITEKRAKPAAQYDPVSTAFVTFGDPKDALTACQVLAVHPDNILSCKVSMAPCFEDLSWERVMKSTYKVEFVKDWVVSIGVWGFTIFWLFPLSFFVSLISIQSISAYWPSLFNYLNKHPWEEEVIQSFVPTVIVALLMLLIPALLFLIGKKAHTILTLSEFHDRIMTRYYKFLIVNVLVFFCVGTAALQSFLLSFSSQPGTARNIVQIVASSFPTAGPFYVGWMIFTTGMHSALEVALFGLPLFSYLSTRRTTIPRRRAVGIRPRTFNYYYWLPNHLLVFEVVVLFSILNPLVVPFGCVYFIIDSTVIKNQFIHVYAKAYEQKGRYILVRLVRYSLDGVILLQVVFLAYMAVLKNKVSVALSAVLIIVTVFIKLVFTRVLRAKFERDDLLEAEIVCGTKRDDDQPNESTVDSVLEEHDRTRTVPSGSRVWRAWKNLSLSYGMRSIHAYHGVRRPRNPFLRPQTCSAINDDATPELSPVPDAKICAHVSSGGEHGKVCEMPISRSRSLGRLDGRLDLEARRLPVAEWRQPQPPEGSATARVLTGEATPSAPLSTPRSHVVQHPPVPAWDDEPDPDTPYDNPYYTAPIGCSLWLPRNPCGPLDLDDTVDVSISLTTTETAKELGQWQAPSTEQTANQPSSVYFTPFSATASPEEGDSLSCSAIPPNPPPYLPSLLSAERTFNGTETISLPPRIESRADDPTEFDRELESNPRPRPSLFRRPSTTRRSSIGATSYFTARSISFGRQITPDVENNSSAMQNHAMTSLFSLNSNIRGRQQSISIEEAVHPDASTQAEFAHSEHPELGIPSALGGTLEPSIVSTQEAVQAEVMVEEREAANARLREEAREVTLTMRRRPWYERWAFAQSTE